MAYKKPLRAVCLCLAAILLAFNTASATTFRLDEFVPLERSSAETLLPRITTSYPTAKFFLSGFSTPSGDWKFVRIEDQRACEADVCPTVVVHSAADWKVLVLVGRDIRASLIMEDGEYIQCEFETKGGRTISIRYSNASKTIFVAP